MALLLQETFWLLALKEEQKENRRLCGRSYNREYMDYVCVNEIGDLIKPHYVTESFPKLLKANGMRQIRFHDLRHSCASLLLANGVPMKHFCLTNITNVFVLMFNADEFIVQSSQLLSIHSGK
mgnify:CR=1 FL=1